MLADILTVDNIYEGSDIETWHVYFTKARKCKNVIMKILMAIVCSGAMSCNEIISIFVRRYDSKGSQGNGKDLLW
jgi:hypothetical protein